MWGFDCEVSSPLPTVNLYRRVMMHEVGCFKLEIDVYACDDAFIIREFIEQRVRQIPVNQTLKDEVFKLEVKNTLD